MALSYVYARKYFDDKAREKVRSAGIFFCTFSSRLDIVVIKYDSMRFPQALEMLLDIKAAFDHMVAELDWMDAETRARAHRKLQAIRPFVGIPQWITDADELNKFYEGVS